MKVAFINYSLYGGGAERNVINLSIYFSKQSIQSDIIIFKDINEYKNEYPELKTAVNILPVFNSDKTTPLLLKPFYLVALLFRLFWLIQKNKYDLLFAAEEYDPFFITVFLALITHKKSILIVGNNIHRELRMKLPPVRTIFGIFFFLAFRLCDHVICVSKGLRNDLMRNYSIKSDKITSIYNGVNDGVIRMMAKEHLSPFEKTCVHGNNTVISMGRLVHKKGFENLIRSFMYVKRTVPDAKLILVGKGPLRRSLESLVKRLGLSSYVLFLGFLQKNPYRVLKHADIFVFPSLYEGFGNTILEAMNCGLPVISTDCPYGPREIIGKSYGLLSPAVGPEDSDITKTKKEKLLGKSISRLLTNNRMRKKYKMASRVRAQSFTLDIMGKNYMRLMQRLNSANQL